MEQKKQDRRYENIMERLTRYSSEEHVKNRKRIRAGIIAMILLPFILGFIRWMTQSDKVLFLIIWVFCMFIIAVYLIGTEYFDYVMQKTITSFGQGEEVSDEKE